MVGKKIIELNKGDCEYLESLNLSYKEMLDELSIKVSVKRLQNCFKTYNIAHKTKAERVALQLNQYEGYSIRRLAHIFKCSPNTIRKAIMIYDKNKNENNREYI